MRYRSKLAEVIARFSTLQGANPTPVEGLTLYRSETTMPRMPVVYEPAICIVAQGRKQLFFGDQSRSYDPDNYLINSLTMPMEAEIQQVGPEQPYLGLAIKADRTVVSQLMLEMGQTGNSIAPPESTDIIMSSALTTRLSDCLIRLLECIEQPLDRQILGPSLQREIFYEVLKGPNGHLLRNCVTNHVGANRIAPVVHFIETNFQQSLDINAIADVASMSPSSLHEHFKQATSMSPMQFVKNLRLHRAHSMLLNGHQASEACYQVGYSSPSQFSREFKRFFGDTPREVQAAALR
ncbi:MAG: AraC family transcriptional regulator [Motiliproteus sp.]